MGFEALGPRVLQCSPPPAEVILRYFQRVKIVRQRYGDDLFGNSLLISRRLVETGSTFITFHWECAVETHGCHWDHHQKAFDMLRFNLPLLDKAYDNLVRDLDQRGLLESTLVVVTGEMGRSPKVNRHAGREHWTKCGFCLLTGGGIQPGSVYGKSDNIGAYPEVDPVSPGDLVATLYPLLGIAPAMSVPDLFGRPAHIAHGGRPLQAILARSTTVGARLRNSAAAAHLLRTTVRSERSPVRCLKSGVCYPILRRPGTRHAYARSKLRQRQPAAH